MLKMCYNVYGVTSTKNLENLKEQNDFNNLPLALEANDIAKVLGISKANAYILMHSKDFPSVQIGRRLIVPKPAFIKWLENPLYFERE